jgi:hypothetical protein
VSDLPAVRQTLDLFEDAMPSNLGLRFLAVLTVQREPLSRIEFPANREKYREIREFCAKTCGRILYGTEST